MECMKIYEMTAMEMARRIMDFAILGNSGLPSAIGVMRDMAVKNLSDFQLTERECTQLSYETIFSYAEIRTAFQHVGKGIIGE